MEKLAGNKLNKSEIDGISNIISDESKEKRIREELERISVHYAEMDKNQKAMVTPLLQNAAFMRVTLEELQEEIQKNGVVEAYQNGANQHGLKQSAALQSYNALIKNYAAVTKTLTQMLPPEKKPALPYSIMGKTQFQWKKIKEQEAEDDPRILFISFEDWLKQKAEEYEPEPDEDDDWK